MDRPRGRAARRERSRCSRSTPTGRPTTSTSSPSTCRPSWSTPTCSTASTSPGCPVRAADRGRRRPARSVAGGHCTYNPEPLADFVDFVVIGDGEEVVGEITEVVREWKAGRQTRGAREGCSASSPRSQGVYVPVDVRRRATTAPFLARVTPRYPDVPATVEKRTIADLAEWPYPKNQLVPLTEVVHDRLNVEVFRGCTRGCRFCQAGMITRPVRERPAEQVRTHDRRGPAAHRLRRGGAHLAVDRRLQRHRRGGRRHRRRSDELLARCRSRCPACGSTPSPSGIAAEIQRARRTGLTFAPEAGTWRMRQVINKLIREEDLYGAVESAFSPGLAAHEALLPHRPAHRDRRGHARHRRAGPQLRRARQDATTRTPSVTVSRRWVRAQAVHPVPVVRSEHRGRAAAQDRTCCATTSAGPGACSSSGTTPRPRSSRASPAGATVGSGRSSKTSGATAAPSRSGREHFELRPVARGHGRARPRRRLVRLPPPHRGRGAPVGPPLGRSPQGLPLAGLARRPRRGRPRGLPVDTVLRLRRLHRLRHRAHRGLGHAAGRRQPGHRARTCRRAVRCRSRCRPRPVGAAPS